ncbi:MAG: carbamoyltransferase N-terminal domain-containing protein [Patescibacteria group bacterium]
MKILGLSFFYHDSAAALLVDGAPVALAEEERFSRKKNDSEFPERATGFVLREGGIEARELDLVVFYEKPFLKLERIMKTNMAAFPFGPRAFIESTKNLFLKKIWIRDCIASRLDVHPNKIIFSEHHLSHAAASFFSSPFERSAILTIDGVGEWAVTAIGRGRGNEIEMVKEIRFPHSLGLLYSAFTAFLGFEVNEGEYKVMGMAPYGTPRYVNEVKKCIRFFEDGSYALNLEYFDFLRSTTRTYSKKFTELFGEPRNPKSKFFTRNTGWPAYFGEKPEGDAYNRMAEAEERYADIAASLQSVHEEAVIRLANHAQELTGMETLCLGGGVALNSVANWKILQKTAFRELYIQPAAGDAGGALGAALAAHYAHEKEEKRRFVMRHAYYGKAFSSEDIKIWLDEKGIQYEFVEHEDSLVTRVAEELQNGQVIGWFHGRFEWGPRALGSRSIIADPRREEMKDVVNTKIKFREPYRPFAPSVLAEYAEEYFEMPGAMGQYPARFMLYVVPVREEKKKVVPAITHVDGTARPQLVFQEDSPRYYKLIQAFQEKTGVPLILNTSFNVKGEPIVATPEDAWNTFMKSDMDLLVLEHFIIRKKKRL